MKCHFCNAEIQEGESFCGVCGQNLNAQPAYTAPVRKKEYMAKHASKNTKTLALVAKIVAVVCAILFIVGGFAILNGNIIEYPIVKLIVPEGEESFDLDTAELEDMTDNLIDEYEDDLSKGDIKRIEAFVDDIVAFEKSQSINNLNNAFNSAKELAKIAGLSDADIEEIEEMVESKEMRDIKSMLSIITVVVWGGVLILVLLVILAGFKSACGWAIPALIINILPSLMFIGVWHFVAVTVAIIALMVIIVKANAEYKKYKKGIA